MNNADSYISARKIFGCYNRMKLEIDTLAKSIEFYSSHKQNEVDSDIYNLSVSHPHGNTGSSGLSASPDKIPQIAERMENIYGDYDTALSAMKYRHNVYSHAVESIDTFVDYLPEERAVIIRRLYIDKPRRTFGEISAEINLSERRIKQIAKDILLEYADTANYDLSMIVDAL